MNASEKPMFLPVESQSRYTVSGEITQRLRVKCPRRVAVDLERCLACDRFDGLSVDVAERACVTCRAEASETFPTDDPALERAARHPAWNNIADTTLISDAMRRSVVCVSRELPLHALAAVLLEHGISGAPVVDERGSLLGIVSRTDLIRTIFAPIGESPTEPEGGNGKSLGDITVGDIMMPVPFALLQNERLSRAAAIMAFEGVHGVPVLGVDGKIAGIISSLDIVRWLSKDAGFVPSE